MLPYNSLKQNSVSISSIDQYSQKETDYLNKKLYTKLLKKAKTAENKENWKLSKHFLLKAHKLSKNMDLVHSLSKCFTRLEEYEEAAKFFNDNLPYFLKEGSYWGLLATHNYTIDDFEAAAGASLKAIQIHNLHLPELWKIFVYSAKKIKRSDLLYEVCKQYLDKKKSIPYVIEGFLTACCLEAHVHEGLKFIQTENIKPDNIERYGEISAVIAALVAAIYHRQLDKTELSHKTELIWNKKASELDPSNLAIKWNLSLSQLKNGLVLEGLRNYDVRFLRDDFPSPIRKFRVPIWTEEVEKNRKILLWYEQGIGDELRFLSAVEFFKTHYPNLIIEPSNKLIGVVQDAFPDLEVRKSSYNKDLITEKEDFDYHLPIGNVFSFFIRMNLEKLERGNSYLTDGYLKPDKLRAYYWKSKLDSLSNKPKIGFCWRSGMVDSYRAREYSVLDNWRQLFELDDFSFVNLQYDVSQDEFEATNPILSKHFLNTGFLDQKDDLEGAASLISNLDFVISPGSSPSMISSCLGIPTLVYSSPDIHWFGRNHKFAQHPIFKKTTIYPSTNVSEDKLLISNVTSFTKEYLLK